MKTLALEVEMIALDQGVVYSEPTVSNSHFILLT